MVAAFSLVAVSAGLSPRGAVACASIATLAAILAALGPTLRFDAFPRWPLVIQALAAAILIGSLSRVPTEPAAWLAGKIVASPRSQRRDRLEWKLYNALARRD